MTTGTKNPREIYSFIDKSIIKILTAGGTK